MPKPFTEWTVLPHGRLSRVDEKLLTVAGNIHMPLGDFPRRMTVVRLDDHRLIIYSAIALHESEMHQLESFGEPAYLIIPGELHRMDAKIWKQRYPSMVVVAPAGAREKIEEVVHVDCTSVVFLDPAVRLVEMEGTQSGELVLEVQSSAGTTLVTNDLIWNVADRPGVSGWLFRLFGFTGGEPHVPPMIKMRAVKDKAALRRQLDDWAHRPGLSRIIVSHGSMITDQPGEALARVADALAM